MPRTTGGRRGAGPRPTPAVGETPTRQPAANQTERLGPAGSDKARREEAGGMRLGVSPRLFRWTAAGGQAVQKLIEGIHQFREQDFRPLQGLFEQLAKGQNPETLFVTCSDSRIDPNLLTRSMPGELFILRNAGNIVPPHGSASGGEAATIEFAVAGLGVRDIIICGHSHCGAMGGLLRPEEVADLPAVAAWLSHAEATRRIIRDNYGHLDEDRRLATAVEENVLVQLENLRTLPSV